MTKKRQTQSIRHCYNSFSYATIVYISEKTFDLLQFEDANSWNQNDNKAVLICFRGFYKLFYALETFLDKFNLFL